MINLRQHVFYGSTPWLIQVCVGLAKTELIYCFTA